MANPDVTDEVVGEAEGDEALRELDSSGTQVTDAGLKPSAASRSCEVEARLGRRSLTKVFTRSLSVKDSLMELDLQHTQVSPETVKAWRDAMPGRRAMRS